MINSNNSNNSNIFVTIVLEVLELILLLQDDGMNYFSVEMMTIERMAILYLEECVRRRLQEGKKVTELQS